ncbi:MAG: rubrerythrin [Burkholderiales bacterium]|nr:rubrerythrin [Burkholderiales bacterium]
MGRRLLPRTLPELYAHALAMEREAAKRFAELEQLMRDTGIEHVAEEFGKIGREEKEQYELLALGTAGRELPEVGGWEYSWHFLGPEADRVETPTNAREAIAFALRTERRTQHFYGDVAENALDEAVRAFAAEMAADERRHVLRLELLLAREPEAAPSSEEDAGGAVLA